MHDAPCTNFHEYSWGSGPLSNARVRTPPSQTPPLAPRNGQFDLPVVAAPLSGDHQLGRDFEALHNAIFASWSSDGAEGLVFRQPVVVDSVRRLG